MGFCLCANWQRANHSLRREMWELSRYGFLPGRVEWGWKENTQFLFHNTTLIAWRPGDLPSCVGWLLCDHSLPFFNHNSLLFFPTPSFLLTSTSFYRCLEMIFWSQSIMWASVKVPTDSMPTTQSPKRRWSFGMELVASANISSYFFPFQWFIVQVLQFCEVSMDPFFSFIIVCVTAFVV